MLILLTLHLQKKKKYSTVDLWKAATALHPDQLYCCKENAWFWLAALLAELSQNPHKCNIGRIKFSALLADDELLF